MVRLVLVEVVIMVVHQGGFCDYYVCFMSASSSLYSSSFLFQSSEYGSSSTSSRLAQVVPNDD